MYKDYVFESFRNDYCERVIIQGKNLCEVIKELHNDFGKGFWYLCVE